MVEINGVRYTSDMLTNSEVEELLGNAGQMMDAEGLAEDFDRHIRLKALMERDAEQFRLLRLFAANGGLRSVRLVKPD